MGRWAVWTAALAFIGFLSVSASLARAQELQLFRGEPQAGGPWLIKAEKIVYDANRREYEASGRVEIRQGDRRLSADRVQINEITKVARLQGHVVLVLGEDVFSGREGLFNLATRCGEMRDARLFLKRNHFHVESPLLRKTGEVTYYAETAVVTTCDADRPLWSFSARKLAVVLEGYATGQDSRVRLAGVPVLYLPYAVLPVKTTRQSGFLLPSFGQHRAGGTVVELPFYWAISDFADATLFQTVLTNRGYMQGGEYRYRGHQDSGGDFRFFYLNDGSGEAPTHQRYWVAGMMNQQLPGDWNLRLTVDRVSDFNYLKDFNFGYMGLNRYSRGLFTEFGRGLEQEEVNVRVSNLLLSHNFPWANLTAYSQYYEKLRWEDPRPFNRLPGVALYTLPLPLGKLPLSAGLDSSYTYFYQDHGLAGDRLDLHPKMWLQTPVLPGLSFSSRVGLRETLFRVDHTLPEDPPERYISRLLYDSKVSLSGAWARDYGRDAGASRFYRHIVRPEITYWNMPRYEARRYPPFDPFDLGWVVPTNPTTLNLPVRDGDDPLGAVNAMTWSISNHILRRGVNPQGQASVQELLWLRLSHGAFFNSTSMAMDGTDQRHHRFSDILAEMEYYPFRQLTLGLNLGFSPYQEGANRADLKLAILDHKRQNYFLANYVFNRGFANQINLMTYLNLLRSVKTWITYSHTFQTDQRLEKRYGLVLQRQCWGLVLSYTDRPDDKRVGFTFFIPGIGEKMKRSPVRFPEEERRGREGPDLF